MTMLTLIQRFCRRQKIPVPGTVYGSTDVQVLQLMALLEEEGNELVTRGRWESLTREATHTTLAQEDQGAIATIASNGFLHLIPQRAWDRTQRLPLGIHDGEEWQAAKAITSTGPKYSIRVRGGRLLANPAPSAGDTWAFEYASYNWILDNDGSTYKQFFTKDTDTMMFPEELLTRGLRWRWKREKGFDYAEDFRAYEAMVRQALASSGVRKPLNMSDGGLGPAPGVVVPNYNMITPS